MTEDQQVAYVHAMSVAAQAEIEGMRADNQLREVQGYSPAYGHDAFLAVIEKYGIHHNAVLTVFQ